MHLINSRRANKGWKIIKVNILSISFISLKKNNLHYKHSSLIIINDNLIIIIVWLMQTTITIKEYIL